jgi:hypothetical protein
MKSVPATAAFLVLGGTVLMLSAIAFSGDRLALFALAVVCLVAAGVVQALSGRR